MQTNHSRWSRLGINRKFGVAFTLLFFLMLLIVITAYLSLFIIRNAEEDIRISTEIEHQVLEMGRGMEKAHRLLGDFLIFYPRAGLQNAHEQFAQPSIREIAQVISISNRLQETLSDSTLNNISNINTVKVNLYLASAKRFADTSIEFVELISKRAAPDRGLEARLHGIATILPKKLNNLHRLQHLRAEACAFYKEYLLTRQRYLMQSMFNTLDLLHAEVLQTSALQAEQQEEIFTLLNDCRILAEDLLVVDNAIAGKIRDFSLQEQIVTPISSVLIETARSEVEQAQERIDRVYRLAGVVILSIALIGIMTMLTIARLLHHTITGNILRLTASACELGKGNMNARAVEESQDELGQLAHIFNAMASRLQDLVENLEHKVTQRTAELAESESRFRNLVNDLPRIAVQGYDHDRNIIYWNYACELLYGYSEKEALGRKLENLIIPDVMKEDVIRSIYNWYENDVPILSAEIVQRHKDGTKLPVYSSHVMLTSNQGEKTMYCVDISLADLKRAQAEEQKSEAFYRQLFEHSTSGVAVYEAVDNGQDFIFTDFNPAAEQIEGIRRDELIGRRVTEVFPSVRKVGMMDVFQRVWRTGEPASHPVTFSEDNRLQGWRENRVYKLPSGEVVAVYEDITKQKQVEEEKQAMEESLHRAKKMEAIGLMAGGVAHDLNNILSGIIGYPDLILLQLPEESELRAPVKAIQESGERAAAVVADLLTVARGVAGIRTVANVNTMVKEYFQSPECHHLRSLYPHIQFRKEFADTLPNISCSPVHIKKCIMNLVTNAAEALDTSGSITIITKTFIADQQWSKKNGVEQGKYVELTVTDTGTGIPRECIEHIFEPFYTKKELGRSGTGLGLAVVWNTVQEHNGTVLVTSSEQGTTFKLYFPATDEVAIDSEPHEIMAIKGNGEKILVVDDEPQLCKIAVSMLELLKYDVVSVSSGEEAVAYLQNRKVDLVLLDMLMEPGINGRQTYENILKRYPEQKAIVASGFAENSEVKITLQLGASAFVHKPYSMDELGRAVQKCLNG